jgi:hypothetical protein
MLILLKSYFCTLKSKIMRKLLSLIVITLVLASCTDDVKFNNPGLQGLKDDNFWRANDARATITDGKLIIKAYTDFEIVTLGTSSTNVAKYSLGSTNGANFASYTSSLDNLDFEYATMPTAGPVSSISTSSPGTGYANTTSIATTGGSGSGLSVSITVNGTGAVTKITLVSRGNGYLAGDLVTVAGGNLNCRFTVVNVQNSNGEIEITDFDDVNMTVTGKFKFNAISTNDNPFAAEVVNYQYGEFYKIQIYPSL